MTAPLQATQEKMFEVQEALTSATGTPSGGRQCNTIMPFRGTSVPWGSCSKFFLRSRGENKQPALKNNHRGKKGAPKNAICFMCDLLPPPHVRTRTWKQTTPYAKSWQPVWRGKTFSDTIRSASYQSDTELLTGDPDSCLAALGGSQVAPGDAQTPVILRAVKVLHLLTWHVDHHLSDLQPCRQEDSWLLRLAFIISQGWSMEEMKICRERMASEI